MPAPHDSNMGDAENSTSKNASIFQPGGNWQWVVSWSPLVIASFKSMLELFVPIPSFPWRSSNSSG